MTILKVLNDSEHLGINFLPFKMKVKERLRNGAIFTYDPRDGVLICTGEDTEQIVDDGFIYDFYVMHKDKSAYYPRDKTVGTEMFEILNTIGEINTTSWK